ncbi:MAG: hypothetical protein V8Q76_17105 [Bacteroides intestinalis]
MFSAISYARTGRRSWRLTVKTPQGTPAMAEMLATMYDASLDKIYYNRQSFFVDYSNYMPRIGWHESYMNRLYYSCSFPIKDWKVPVMIYGRFYSPIDFAGAVVLGYRSTRKANFTGSVEMATVQSRAMAKNSADMVVADDDADIEEHAIFEKAMEAPEMATGEFARLNFALTLLKQRVLLSATAHQ